MPVSIINVAELAELKPHDYVLIDIRNAESINKGTVNGAIMLDAAAVKAQFEYLKKSHNQVFIMCYQGNSSNQLVAELGAPFRSVEGGFEAWVEAGLAVELPEAIQAIDRYERQVKLPGFGHEAQRKLKDAHVVIIGIGGLGAPVATYLAAAGVGELTLVDADHVAIHNLHRQVLYRENDVNLAKVKAAEVNLMALNGGIKINAVKEFLNPKNAHTIIAKGDLVIDGTDNVDTRLLINDTCMDLQKAWIYAAVAGFNVQVSMFSSHAMAPCYRCMFGDLDMSNTGNCNDIGILGPVPGVAAMIQATESIKVICGLGSLLTEKMLSYDLLNHQFKMLKYPSLNKHCKKHPYTA